MASPRSSHPYTPRSASSVYRLPAPCFGAPCAVNRFNRHCFFRGRNNAVHGPLQSGFCREQHDLSAHSSCSVFLLCPLALPTAGAPSGRQYAEKGPNRDEKWVGRAPSAESILQKDGKRHVRRWRQDREKPFDCDKNMLETENGADSSPNHGEVITPP